ncbi:MAG: hypothetical protein KIS77_08885 [Saprospiraceae bacterium]|nr:hypothetical protein [Saprospiraceae bacterium]
MLTPYHRPLLSAAVWVLTCFTISAQTTLSSLLEQPVSDIPLYDTTACKDCILLQVQYGDSEFRNLDVFKRFDAKNIAQVDVVYSSFSRTKNFDQVSLNRERLTNLEKASPGLFDNESIKWNMLRQTNCRTLEESERLFHGFVVHLASGVAVRSNDGTLMPAPSPVVPTKKSSNKTPLVTRDSTVREMSVSMREITKRECEETGKYIPKNKDKARKGVRYDKPGRNRIPEKKCQTKSLGYAYDTTYFDRRIKINAATGKAIDRSLDIDRRRDTTVIDAMDRNWDDWRKEKVIVVQDVTGSMSGYLTQIFIWHELYASKGVEHYVFFNDGDGKPDKDKVLGKVGGIYYVQSNRLSEIQEVAHRAARAGSGGDNPENNIEAAIYAQTRCPDCSMMVMIADNYAPVRDFKLMSEVRKPVHVVVCGGNGEEVHSDYISIAALTGGAVHTSKMDLDLKGKAVEGTLLAIGERKYIFEKGRFSLKTD